MTKIQGLLNALPDEPDVIAQVLELQGCYGRRRDPARCPVAHYLHRNGVTFPHVTTTKAGAWSAGYLFGEATLDEFQPLTPACQAFIEQFDDGRYPRLERP